MKQKAAAIIAGVLVAAAAGCGNPAADDEPTVEAPGSVQELYGRMAAAMQRDGAVLHTTITLTSSGGNPFAGESTTDLWLDVAHERARRTGLWTYETDNGEQRMDSAEIIADGGVYRVEEGRSRSGQAFTCHASDSAVLSTLLGCHGALEESETRIGGSQRFRGRQSIVVVTEGMSRGEDEKFEFTDRLYVDARTWLPLALETAGTVDYGPKAAYEIHERFEHNFVDAASLPADFFEPASIGYVERDPAAGLAQDLGLTVYWLGREFAPGGGLPKLALRSGGGSSALPGYRATLEYRLAQNRFDPAIIDMQEWRREDWEGMHPESPGNMWNWPGVTSEEISLPGGRAVIFHVPRDTAGAPDRFVAHVYLGDTVILVDDASTPSPYSTAEGMRAIAEGLQPYH